MPNIQIAVINACSILTDDQVSAVVPALQTQVSEHFAPAWGTDATLSFVAQGAQPPAGSWWLSILDDSDRAGNAGYHDKTNEGLPLGKVFARTDRDFGLHWTVTASHELLEMLADPDITLSVFVHPGPNSGMLYAHEICDPCEDDSDGYQINGVLVSDFVYPAYFQSWHAPGSAQFDHLKKLNAPVPHLLSGGYLSAYNVMSGSGWQHITAEKIPGQKFARSDFRARVGSRKERRKTPRNLWLNSTVGS